MLFSSYEFVFAFLPATVVGFWFLVWFAGRTSAMRWLILASIAFYAYANFKSLAIITPLILLDYLIALGLLRIGSSREQLRNVVFSLGVAANAVYLGYFKYKNFFLDTANTVFAMHLELTNLIIPLGISFITFQMIAFLADVQSTQVKAVGFFDFLLFTLFFPRTVAGPIVHYQEIMPQFVDTTPSNPMANAVVGLCLFSLGLFKKIIIADNVSQFVLPTFDPPSWLPDHPVTLLTAWAGVLAYTFQLYFDFSGYSDMALGLARMFGVRLPMNFNSPLKACSIVEFWSRWHITLTRFLTAYIYTPIVLRLTRARMAKGKPVMRGKRPSLVAIAVLVGLPTLVTMAISGLWHGAGWQFVVWGLLHGMYLTINQGWRIFRPRFWPDQTSYERLMKPLGGVLTFGAVVTANVFFRADSVTSALSILGGMTGVNGILPQNVQLLRHLGMSLSWEILGLLLPIAPFIWIVVLLLAVTLLPNSLELLRGFQPALDFPEDPQDVPGSGSQVAAPPVTVEKPKEATKRSAAAKFRAAWAGLRQFGHGDISLSQLTATITALLFVLSVAGLNRGGAFLYGHF